MKKIGHTDKIKVRNWEGETCKRCGRDQRLVWSVHDNHWELVPCKYKNKVLCLECFLELVSCITIDEINITGIAR